MPYPILDPTGTTAIVPRTPRAPRAPRRRDLRGATVGLLVNTKQNAAPFLDEVGRLLIAKHGAIGTMARTKVNFAAPAPDDLVKEMTTDCDVIVTGIGPAFGRTLALEAAKMGARVSMVSRSRAIMDEVAAAIGRIHAPGNPELRVVGKRVLRRHHADDGEGAIVETH